LWSQNILTNRIQTSPIRRSFLDGLDGQFPIQGVDPVLLLQPTNVNYPTAIAYLNSLPAASGGPALAALHVPLAITARVQDFGPRTNKTRRRKAASPSARAATGRSRTGKLPTCTTGTTWRAR
jgi:iron complex outermembrane receptor protein